MRKAVLFTLLIFSIATFAQVDSIRTEIDTTEITICQSEEIEFDPSKKVTNTELKSYSGLSSDSSVPVEIVSHPSLTKSFILGTVATAIGYTLMSSDKNSNRQVGVAISVSGIFMYAWGYLDKETYIVNGKRKRN